MLRSLKQNLREKSVLIVGQGHWGKALGHLLSESFKSVKFLDSLSTSEEWKNRLRSTPLVVLACPFAALPEVFLKLRSYKIAGVINASKGIDRATLRTFSNLAPRYIKAPIATLSGPTFAEEVLKKKPTACVLAGKNIPFLQNLAQQISTDYFRVYVSSDPTGVEACGAMKNVLAIACGVSDGLHLGDNARAALLTRGLLELKAVVEKLGGRSETVFGLAGVGDLWLTATGDLSRNRQLGLKLAKGISLEKALKTSAGICEGIYTVKQIHKLAEKYKLDLPISTQVYRICFGRQNPKRALQELMNRELKVEGSKLSQAR